MNFESVARRVPRTQRVQCLRAAIHANIDFIRNHHRTFDAMATDEALSDEERRVCRARAARVQKLEKMYVALSQNDLPTARRYHNQVSIHDVEEMELMCGKQTVCAVIKNELKHGKETVIYMAVANETKLDYDARQIIFNIFNE